MQVEESVGRVFKCFIPHVRVVSPLSSLLSIQTARCQIASHLHQNLRIPSGFHLISHQTIPISETQSSKWGTTGHLRPADALAEKLDITQFTNSTIFGNIFPLKAALLGGGSPCNPTCILLTKSEIQRIINDDRKTPYLNFWPYFFQQSDKLIHAKGDRQCRQFLAIASSARLLCLARQATCSFGIIGSVMTVSGPEVMDRMRDDLLAIGYIHLQHNSTEYSKAIGSYILRTTNLSESLKQRSRELLVQCALRSGKSCNRFKNKLYLSDNPDEAEELIEEMYKSSKDGSQTPPEDVIFMLSHLSLAAYYLYNAKYKKCLDHISRTVKLTEFDSSHWLSLSSLSIMVNRCPSVSKSYQILSGPSFVEYG